MSSTEKEKVEIDQYSSASIGSQQSKFWLKCRAISVRDRQRANLGAG